MALNRAFTPLAAALLLSASTALFAADHLDSPLPSANRQLDLADVYLFRSPADSRNVVLVSTYQSNFDMAGGYAGGPIFTDQGVYKFFIDTNGDTTPEITLTTQFSDNSRKFKITGFNFGNVEGDVTQLGEAEPRIASINGVKAFCGPRDDPFFFDLVGFREFVAAINAAAPYFPAAGLRSAMGGVPANTFNGNIAAIVIEVPIVLLTNNPSPNVGSLRVWAKTFRNQL